MLPHALPRVAAASLLALSLAACSGGDDDEGKKAAATREVLDTPGILGTVDQPESTSGCETSLKILWPETGERQFMTYGAAVGADDGRALTLYASDQKLDLDALPESPRRDGNDLMVVEIKPNTRKKPAALVLGDQVAKDAKFAAELKLMTGDSETGAVGEPDYQYVLTEFAGEGNGVCVKVTYTDDEKQISGLIFGPLVLTAP